MVQVLKPTADDQGITIIRDGNDYDCALILRSEEKVKEVHLSLTGPQLVADITTILQRAMNTWENPPAWARKLADEINGVPAPATRQEPGNG